MFSSGICRVIGHRGASFDHPENTLEAFRGAKAQGADWVELDVRRTSDGALVVHHDPHLADGRLIAEIEGSEVPAEVATLADALAASMPMGINVEIKNFDGEAGFDDTGSLAAETVAAIRASGAETLISSFDLATIDACRAEDPTIPTGYLVYAATEPVDAVNAAVAGGHAALHPWYGLVDVTLVERCHDAGLLINVWTVDEPERISQLAAWGVDGIVTNRPDVALAALGRAELGRN